MKKTKSMGQGAMEYLMTYGWAILVVMVVGLVMWQLGIFNIGGTTPARVSGFNYQKPIDATLQITSTEVKLSMVNGEPGTIKIGPIASGTINGVALTACAKPALNDRIKQGAKYDIECTHAFAPTLEAGDVASAEITFGYTINIAGVSRTRTESGQARGPVES